MVDKLKVDTRITVETPEGVDFQFRIAGLGKRGIAMGVDLIFKTVTIIGLSILATIFEIGTGGAGLATGLLLFAWFLINWMYSAFFEAFWNGQTPGKRLFNLRVVRGNGTPISFYEAFGRNLLLAADALPLTYTVGMISMALSPRMQRLGDIVFDTIVVDETSEYVTPRINMSGVEPIARSECTGRYHVPERTLTIIERLFDDQRAISDARREEIALILAVPLRERLGYESASRQAPVADSGQAIHWQPPQSSAYSNGIFLKRVLRTFSDAFAEPTVKPKPEEADIAWLDSPRPAAPQSPPVIVNRGVNVHES